MKLAHIMLRVSDAEKSLEFYEKLFGFSLSKTMELDDAILYFLASPDGNTQIELTYNFDTPKEGYSQGNAFGHLAFEVDSISDFSNKMSNLGFGQINEIYPMSAYNIQIAFLQDPDGNNIELIEQTYYLA